MRSSRAHDVVKLGGMESGKLGTKTTKAEWVVAAKFDDPAAGEKSATIFTKLAELAVKLGAIASESDCDRWFVVV